MLKPAVKQLLFQHDRHKKEYSDDLLYLAGYRWNTGISTFNMMGVRREDFERGGKFVGVFNTSWFYYYSERLTVGIELNNEFEANGHWNYLLTPQIHWNLTQHATLQFSIGVSQHDRRNTEWSGTWRMVYAPTERRASFIPLPNLMNVPIYCATSDTIVCRGISVL